VQVLLIPALDLLGGRCVRLLKGDFARETVYGDPLEIARAYREAGARRLHVVDLDAARGEGSNRDLVARLVSQARVSVQVAGGVRTSEDVAAWLDAGAAAAVMGTTAVREPARLRAAAEAHPGRVLAALDVRAGQPAVSGWTDVETLALADLLAAWEAAPLDGVILTSVDRDGTLAGPDLAALAEVLAATRHRVVYSGGIGSLEDVAAVAAAGASALILGKALLEGRFELPEALEIAS
jgi:phosphoribosylformimino-5-aminoimidazole carboxamide ribotide isomerase